MNRPVRQFTATVFVINQHTHTLLLWHKRLQRWMPPGGHLDPHETPEEAAVRECKEETGLDVAIIGERQQDWFEQNPSEGRMLIKPFALLLEYIPACRERGEEAHEHMDFVFVGRVKDEHQLPVLATHEGDDMRWFSREQLEALDERTDIFSNVKQYALSVLSQGT